MSKAFNLSVTRSQSIPPSTLSKIFYAYLQLTFYVADYRNQHCYIMNVIFIMTSCVLSPEKRSLYTYQRLRKNEAELLRNMIGVQRKGRFGFCSSHQKSISNPETATVLRLPEWVSGSQPAWTLAQSSL